MCLGTRRELCWVADRSDFSGMFVCESVYELSVSDCLVCLVRVSTNVTSVDVCVLFQACMFVHSCLFNFQLRQLQLAVLIKCVCVCVCVD